MTFDPRELRAGAAAARAVLDSRTRSSGADRSTDPAERHRAGMVEAERQFDPDRARIREQAAADIEGWIAEASPKRAERSAPSYAKRDLPMPVSAYQVGAERYAIDGTLWRRTG